MTGHNSDASRLVVAALVERYRRNESDYRNVGYNETQARTDFITPFLEAFGWDVHNVKRQPRGLREVVEEANVDVGDERLSKKPDYELRLARQRKLFVEAKKPSVRIDRDRRAAFQARRYGFSANLPITILTNFSQLAIYDCRVGPREGDEAHVARLLLVDFDDFEIQFAELWSSFSRESVYSGEFDRRFAVGVSHHGTQQFDDLFLGQVRRWRERLAIDIHANSPGLSPTELTYAVQLFLCRLVFLRICEDRDIETYGNLRDLDSPDTFNALMDQLRRADAFYDSGLFDLLDDERLGLRIGDGTLRDIIAELYYPESPYTFAVVETEVLGEIYEQFLGEEIAVVDGAVVIIAKPEVREGGGVVPTPRYIVDAIVERTLGPSLTGKSPDELAGFTVADICCGSGVFLLAAYEQLLDHYLSWYVAGDRGAHNGRTIYDAGGEQWRLTFEERRRILLAHIRGVDIDSNAVEVSRFSLLVKLLDGESAQALQDFVGYNESPALPALDSRIRSGNSLVSRAEWIAAEGGFPPGLAGSVNPFDWSAEFPSETGRGGFDVIVGNPPYIRIQNMTEYAPAEVAYYQNPQSPFETARIDNFDKYALFVERSLGLLRETGRLGVIVPHKFMTIQSGRALRRLLTTPCSLEEIVHFGVKQVFGAGTTNYTCILVLNKRGSETIRIEQPGPLEEWRYGREGVVTAVPATDLSQEPWQLATAETRELFDRVAAACPDTLEIVAEILVGLQTSADDAYMFRAVAETATTLRWDNADWAIEREVVRPCLLDVRLVAYTRPEPNAWMIFPYRITTKPAGGRIATLIQPDEFQQLYPACWRYLIARRAELEGRNIVGGRAADRQWYQYGRSQSLTKLDDPKIILPVLSKEPRCAYDDLGTAFTGGGNGPYYMVRARPGQPVSNKYLLAILNHPLAEALIRTNTSPFRGGYYSHGKQFIESLPVPRPTGAQRTAIENLVDGLILGHDQIARARTPHERLVLERTLTGMRVQVDSLVSGLFGLSPADLAVVAAVPIPT
jgi:hypothetical protein